MTEFQRPAIALVCMAGSAFVAMVPNPSAAQGYHIGVYYFPGWKENQPGAPSPNPWEPIKSFPERKPIIGWYPEGNQEVMDEQLNSISKAGIEYVVFSQLFNPDGTPQLGHAVSAFLTSKKRHGTQFSVHWDNSGTLPRSADEFNKMIIFCIENYFVQPSYLRINGRPVFFVFIPDRLSQNAAKFDSETSALLSQAQLLAKQHGLPGITFVANSDYQSARLENDRRNGYSATSAYNYAVAGAGGLLPHSYKARTEIYQSRWAEVAKSESSLTYILPITSGWDRRPWGGTPGDPLLDEQVADRSDFQFHLEEARHFIDAHRALTRGFAVICCWNEFGEGSYIEPTVGRGDSFLTAIRAVFGSSN